jgi:dephospho-CoA kinase
MKKKDSLEPLAIGVTGGIGSGKTEVCKILGSLGATVLSADAIAKELIDMNTEIKKRLQRTFGNGMFNADGTLNRKQMAKLVFTDDSMKDKLDDIVHPFVLEYLEKKIKDLKRTGGGSLIVVEAALIYEARAEKMFDYVVAVYAETEETIERVMKRDQTTRPEVLQRMNAQIPIQDKAARADFTIRNSGNVSLLEKNCKFLYNLLMKMSVHHESATS